MSYAISQATRHESVALSAPVKAVFSAIADHASTKTGQAWPSIATIAAKSSVSVRGVYRAIKVLVQGGWLHKRNQTRSDGGSSSNLYTIVLTKLCHLVRGGGDTVSSKSVKAVNRSKNMIRSAFSTTKKQTKPVFQEKNPTPNQPSARALEMMREVERLNGRN
jgi:hypothetical protein